MPVEFKAERVLSPLARSLAPGGRMIAIQSRGPGYIIDTARHLHQAGLRPVPHIAARRVTSRDDLAGFRRRDPDRRLAGGSSQGRLGPTFDRIT